MARIWQGIADDFVLNLALWKAFWQLLARIWQEIADFALNLALWQALKKLLGGVARHALLQT